MKIRCGNHEVRTYHPTTQDVRNCYQATAVEELYFESTAEINERLHAEAAARDTGDHLSMTVTPSGMRKIAKHLDAPSREWWNLPLARCAWEGDALQWEGDVLQYEL